jgi:predicted TIM-barrel fold metal-dependent hydrolase
MNESAVMTAIELIDADAHVNPPPAFWDEYLPSRLKGRGPQIEPGTEAEGHDWVVFEGSRKPLMIVTSVAGQGADHRTLGRLEEMGAGGYEPGVRLADMNHDGVDRAVLFGGGPLGSTDNDLFVESFGAYNRWLADFCSHDPKRLVGVAYLPMQDVGKSIEMLKDAARRGMRAVNIPAFPMSEAGGTGGGGFAAQVLALTGDPNGPRQYDSEEFDPFWKACVDHDLAVTIHLGARVARPGMQRAMVHSVMSKVSMAEPISMMIFGGVFDRFPELRFGSIESGVGWFAWMAEYMDNFYRQHPTCTSVKLKQLPSYYMDNNVWGSFIRDPVGISQRHRKGGGNIMWSSDYPHSETSWPDSRGEIEKQFEGLSEEERRPILYDNAKRFYGL